MAGDRTLPADVAALAVQAMAARKATSGGPVAPARREIRGVILGMTGLLGKQKDEDAYIRALLMVDGVTSVTVDRVRAALALAAVAALAAAAAALAPVAAALCSGGCFGCGG